jgi:hypothetical protein
MKNLKNLNIKGAKMLTREQTRKIKGGDNMVCDWVGGVYICFDVIDVVDDGGG